MIAQHLKEGSEMPSSIGRCADLYKEVRDLRLAMEKEVEPIKVRENEIREHIISNLSKSDDTGAAGLKYRAQVIVNTKPRVNDWPTFHKWIVKQNRFDCLQKRIAEKAIKDMWEDNISVPGVEKVHVPSLSITKI